MRIPTLDPQLSLQTTRREVRYTLLRLRRRPWAKGWVPVFEALLKETDAAIVSESQLNDALEDAEVALSHFESALHVRVNPPTLTNIQAIIAKVRAQATDQTAKG